MSDSQVIKFSLLVTGNPASDQSASTALQFCEAALAAGHHISGVFFYLDGVLTASHLISPASDEVNLPDRWAALAIQHHFPLEVCVSASLRRGIVNEIEAKHLDLQHYNLKTPFVLSGLGQLAELSARCDRLIQF
ncbi:sulfurtransferase complex subunit TusD [Psychromonas sp. 14N.309.X.WAT.B.A12]|uniref:sulfurtransferase complex subunit TusD n=1 Tax=Psychromonas sp. 14N.309.X.WAT.B.A12 TaxID=2998322 RepID=UPI0025AF7B45|nr:sulfurtransferase complex subunit TusD [Psychromonas sp. 14N.309.X.WAT.B.A12]MDN2664374.1 sulfurtransferase complex subunit TusD [Psychromonas sp. 14N.309.X.WAT.B.A12]